MFITCSCERCHQPIEFSTDDFVEFHRAAWAIYGQNVNCPGCEKQTRLYIPQTIPQMPPVMNSPRLKKRNFPLIAGAVLAILVISIGIFALSRIGVENASERAGTAVGGLILTILFSFAILLGISWLLFPLLMYFQLKRSNELLEMVERNTREMAAKSENPSVPG